MTRGTLRDASRLPNVVNLRQQRSGRRAYAWHIVYALRSKLLFQESDRLVKDSLRIIARSGHIIEKGHALRLKVHDATQGRAQARAERHTPTNTYRT